MRYLRSQSWSKRDYLGYDISNIIVQAIFLVSSLLWNWIADYSGSSKKLL